MSCAPYGYLSILAQILWTDKQLGKYSTTDLPKRAYQQNATKRKIRNTQQAPKRIRI